MTVHDYKLVCPNYRLFHHGRICELCVGSRLALHPLRTRCQRDSRAESALIAIESSWHRLRRVYLRGVDCFVAPSRFLATMLLRQGYPQARIEIVPNAPRRRGEPAPASQRDAVPTLLYAGRLSEEKGVASLIEAVRDAPPWRLRVAGDGPQASQLRTQAAACDRIVFLGHLNADELAAERARAWAVALPSIWYENAPLSLLEAYASARPVLVSDHGGLVELVDEGVEGRRLPPGEAAAWSAALRELTDQAPRLSAMGEAAWRRLAQRHDFAQFLAAHLRLYERLLRKRSSLGAS
jgi:glycosyltransferase involved in cell wall biosynthesis